MKIPKPRSHLFLSSNNHDDVEASSRSLALYGITLNNLLILTSCDDSSYFANFAKREQFRVDLARFARSKNQSNLSFVLKDSRERMSHRVQTDDKSEMKYLPKYRQVKQFYMTTTTTTRYKNMQNNLAE
jgi:hypothetical protein